MANETVLHFLVAEMVNKRCEMRSLRFASCIKTKERPETGDAMPRYIHDRFFTLSLPSSLSPPPPPPPPPLSFSFSFPPIFPISISSFRFRFLPFLFFLLFLLLLLFFQPSLPHLHPPLPPVSSFPSSSFFFLLLTILLFSLWQQVIVTHLTSPLLTLPSLFLFFTSPSSLLC